MNRHRCLCPGPCVASASASAGDARVQGWHRMERAARFLLEEAWQDASSALLDRMEDEKQVLLLHEAEGRARAAVAAKEHEQRVVECSKRQLQVTETIIRYGLQGT